jgi:hypothetical protein
MNTTDAIKRLRATQGSNPTTMFVCDELQKLLGRPEVMVQKTKVPSASGECPVCQSRRLAKTLAQQRWRKKKGKG